MSPLTKSLLLVFTLWGIGMVYGTTWIRNYLRRIKLNRQAGLYDDPEVKRRLQRLMVLGMALLPVQLLLVGVLVYLTVVPKDIGPLWIAVAILLAVATVAQTWVSTARRRLLMRGRT